MADEPRIKHILDLAHKRGFLKPSQNENECFVDCINTANFMLFLLKRAGIQGLSTSQVVNRSGMALNSCKIYLRKLTNLGYLEREKKAREDAIWTYKGDKE